MMHATLPTWEHASADEKIAKLRGLIDDLYRYSLGDAVNNVIRFVEAHQPDDEAEAQSKQLILAACRAHPNILNANCEVGHITGSGLVIDPKGKRVLLNYHAKLQKWLQFGGHAEYETEPWRVALRETHEESSLPDLQFYPNAMKPVLLDLDAHVIPQRKNLPAHYHYDLRYLLATHQPELAQASDESGEIRWLKFNDIDTLPLESGVLRMIRKAERIILNTPSE